jgi:DNA polymerase III delta subunit
MAVTRTMPKPVYALVGDDSFLQLQALGQVASQFSDDVARIEFDGERAELSDVLDELRSFAMFGGGDNGAKIVVVRNGDEFITRFRERLEDYLAAPSTSATLVLRVASLPKTQRVAKLIDKIGQIVPCEPPAVRQLPAWIVNRAKTEHKISIAPDAVALLADLIGADLGRLDNELAKLALQVDAGGKVEVRDVSGSIAFQREQEIKDMTIELAAGKPGEALKRWRRLVELDSSAEFRAVTWLTMWLEDVGTIVAGRSAGNLGWKYKERLPEFIRVAKSMGRAGHARAIDRLAELDKQSKSGVGAAAENVERFILSLAS